MVNVKQWQLGLCLITSIFSHALYAAQCEFTLRNEWNSGFTAAVKITNDTAQDIQGWSVSLAYADGTTITNMWNANLAGANPYQATNKNYNARIAANQSVEFGFNGNKGTQNVPAEIPSLGDICGIGNESNQRPIADANASEILGSIPFTVDFDASGSEDPEGETLTYSWDFDDGNTSTEVSPTHTFTEVGNYNVSLVVSDGEMDSQASTLTIVAEAPQPEDALCEFEVVNEWNSGFTSAVKIHNDVDYPIQGWRVSLNFPDGSEVSGAWNATVSGNNPYQFVNANYNATIQPGSQVEFGFNTQKASADSPAPIPELGGICRQGVEVNNPPLAVANVSPLQGTVPFTVTFDASASSDVDGDELSYLWTLADGSTSNEANFEQVIDEAGSYPVSLIVNDGNLDSETVMVTIQASEPTPGQAYSLNNSLSSIHFVSTKKVHLLETHTFTDISAQISAEGAASLSINLASVESNIDIRNQRMREHLFEVDTFATAQVTLPVDLAQIASMTVAGSQVLSISPNLDLHGVSATLETDVRITKLSDSRFMVQNLNPIIIQAADFDLTAGIEMLRQLAGLDVISYSVPVNFTLVFDAQE